MAKRSVVWLGMFKHSIATHSIDKHSIAEHSIAKHSTAKPKKGQLNIAVLSVVKLV